jgi:hypothetical protein
LTERAKSNIAQPIMVRAVKTAPLEKIVPAMA